MTTGARIRRGLVSGVAGSLAAAGAVAVLDGTARTGAFWTASGTTVDTGVPMARAWGVHRTLDGCPASRDLAGRRRGDRRNPSYHGALAANASTTFGFLSTGVPPAPTFTCTSP
jgi:hypothetical protein